MLGQGLPTSISLRQMRNETHSKNGVLHVLQMLVPNGNTGDTLAPSGRSWHRDSRARDTTEKIHCFCAAQTSANSTLLEQGRRSGRRPDPALLSFQKSGVWTRTERLIFFFPSQYDGSPYAIRQPQCGGRLKDTGADGQRGGGAGSSERAQD